MYNIYIYIYIYISHRWDAVVLENDNWRITSLGLMGESQRSSTTCSTNLMHFFAFNHFTTMRSNKTRCHYPTLSVYDA